MSCHTKTRRKQRPTCEHYAVFVSGKYFKSEDEYLVQSLSTATHLHLIHLRLPGKISHSGLIKILCKVVVLYAESILGKRTRDFSCQTAPARRRKRFMHSHYIFDYLTSCKRYVCLVTEPTTWENTKYIFKTSFLI